MKTEFAVTSNPAGITPRPKQLALACYLPLLTIILNSLVLDNESDTVKPFTYQLILMLTATLRLRYSC